MFENPIERAIFSFNYYLEFTKFGCTNKLQFVIYCDFEAYNSLANLFKQKSLCFGIYMKSNYPYIFLLRYCEYCDEETSKEFVWDC